MKLTILLMLTLSSASAFASVGQNLMEVSDGTICQSDLLKSEVLALISESTDDASDVSTEGSGI